jgi:hypothetical protein
MLCELFDMTLIPKMKMKTKVKQQLNRAGKEIVNMKFIFLDVTMLVIPLLSLLLNKPDTYQAPKESPIATCSSAIEPVKDSISCLEVTMKTENQLHSEGEERKDYVSLGRSAITLPEIKTLVSFENTTWIIPLQAHSLNSRDEPSNGDH